MYLPIFSFAQPSNPEGNGDLWGLQLGGCQSCGWSHWGASKDRLHWLADVGSSWNILIVRAFEFLQLKSTAWCKAFLWAVVIEIRMLPVCSVLSLPRKAVCTLGSTTGFKPHLLWGKKRGGWSCDFFLKQLGKKDLENRLRHFGII